MSDQFVGEIRAFGFNHAPRGWATCQGQLMSISQNTALFSLLGTNFGGDGRSTFALPNLQGCIPNGAGSGVGLSPYAVGQTGGQPAVALSAGQMPAHTHTLPVSSVDGKLAAPSPITYLGATGSRGESVSVYSAPPQNPVPMLVSAVGLSPGGQPHNNMGTFLVVNYCIALQGIFPSRP